MNRLKALLLSLSIAFSAALSAQARVAYVDTQKILSRIPEYEQAQNQINKLSEQWAGEVESLRSEADALENAYQAEKVLLTTLCRRSGKT